MSRTVELGTGGLILAGEETERLVLSGEMHYWRLDPDRWGEILDRIVELGFTTVSTYVPWVEHEPAPGVLDTGGARDVVAFLRAVHERGLLALVRVGPDSGAEQEASGWPHWLVSEPDTQARRPNGEPYLLVSATGFVFPPSYASTTFLTAAERWYAQIVPMLAPLQWPDGPIVACQVDNELGFHFQANAFALDHHPDALVEYRRWLRRQWGDLSALNDAYGTAYGSFDAVIAPADAVDFTERCRIDWVAWREQHRRDVLSQLATWARGHGMDRVPLMHNDYPRTDTPMELGALEADGVVDWAAADIYAGRSGGRFVRDLARRLAGSSHLPFMAELGAGWLTLPWLLPLEASAADEEVIALRTFLSGAKASNVFMLVERNRWYGSPVDIHGRLREGAGLWPRLRALLDRVDWVSLRRHRSVLLLDNRAEQRLRASHDTFADLVPCFQQLLPLDYRLSRMPDTRGESLTRWETGLVAALDTAGVDADVATTASMPDLQSYDTVVVPCLGSLEPAAWDRLAAAASSGRRVIVGPRLPDEVGELPTGVTVIGDPAELIGLLPAPPVGRTDPNLDLHLWTNGDRQVLAAFNNSDAVLRTWLTVDRSDPSSLHQREGGAHPSRPGRQLTGLWHDESLRIDDNGGVEIELGQWGVQVWEIENGEVDR